MVDTSELVAAPHKTLSDSELRFLPVTALLGVTDDMAAALAGLGIETILDLAVSRVFAQAGNVLASIGLAADEFPGDLLKVEVPAADLPDAETLAPDRLHGLDDAVAQALSQALGTATIRAFALWSPYRAARAISGLDDPDTDEDEDPAAARLRPMIGQFPTENSYYSTLIMLGSEDQPQLDPLTGPLSLDNLLGQNAAFGTPAIGAIATYVQSWISQGVTLGHMLHSLALAPGEATRIAVIDWSRTTSARVTEDIGETEALSSSQTHARAISEIQSGVANEMQVGGSSSDATSTSTSEASASAAAGGFGLALPGLVVGGAGGGTQNDQSATTTTNANSSSWTMGNRDILSTMDQTVNDRTEQQANVVRNRRASSVREVSQSEHEQISTRIVANYNHMHALTIQYYEVVQAYMVTARLHAFDRAIFLPFSLLDFSGANAADLVARFRRQLILGALTARARSLLIDDRGVVALRGATRFTLPALTDVAITADPAAVATLGTASARAPDSAPAGPVATGTLAAEVATKASVLRGPFTSVRQGPLIGTTDGDAVLEAISFEDIAIDVVRLDRDGVPSDQATFPVSGTTALAELPGDILLREITGGFVRRAGGEDTSGTMVLHLRTAGQGSEVRVPLGLSDSMAMQRVLYVTADAADRRAELMQHLQTNQVHYTQAVFTNLDNPALIQLLAGLSFQGRALTEQIEPRVQAVIGNYLVLPAPVNADEDVSIGGETKTWETHMSDRGIDFASVDRRLISVPTGGVFAEAVLGRSNSAEKLDITRFWNWQDSPIPLTPPEIAPISAASRGEVETLTPGQLSAPILNVSNPTNLPDPAGLGAILSALADGNMFRNLSGLEGTQSLAGSVSAGTLTAATEAGKLASQNFGTVAKLASSLANAAVKTIATGKAGDAENKKANGGISGDGAKINEAKKHDAKKGTGGGSGGTKLDDNLMVPDFASGGGVSRETAALDTAISGNSPGLTGEVLSQFQEFAGASHVASVPTTTSALTGGGPLPFLNSVQNIANDPIGSLYLTIIEVLSARIGIDLKGASLERMSQHKHSAQFMQLFGAWTDSVNTVYMHDHLWVNGIDVDSIRLGLQIAHHEAVHIAQFIANQNAFPGSFEEMVDFEKESYQADIDWAQGVGGPSGGLNAAFGIVHPSLAMSNAQLSAFQTSSAANITKLDAIIASAPAAQNAAAREAHFRDELIAKTFLPTSVTVGGQVTSTYSVPQLYGP